MGLLDQAHFLVIALGAGVQRYRHALQRTSRYFITDLDIKEVEDEQAEDIKDILENYLKD